MMHGFHVDFLAYLVSDSRSIGYGFHFSTHLCFVPCPIIGQEFARGSDWTHASLAFP